MVDPLPSTGGIPVPLPRITSPDADAEEMHIMPPSSITELSEDDASKVDDFCYVRGDGGRSSYHPLPSGVLLASRGGDGHLVTMTGTFFGGRPSNISAVLLVVSCPARGAAKWRRPLSSVRPCVGRRGQPPWPLGAPFLRLTAIFDAVHTSIE